MSMSEREQFDRDGYLLVRDVFSAEQAAQLREFFMAQFNVPPDQYQSGDTDSSLVNIFCRYPQIRWLLFNERTLRAFKMLCGDDFVFIPPFFAALNNFVNWHKDTTAWERQGGHMTHWEDGYRMIGFLYYLQDNSEDYGGGLEVEPGSHLTPDPFVRKQENSPPPLRKKIASKMKALWYKTTGRKPDTSFRPRNTVAVPSKAGDLVLCHFRLNHRACPPRKFPLPADQEKICLTGAISNNNRRFIQDRLEYYHQRGGCFYPKGLVFPADFVEEAKSHGVSFPTDEKGRV